MAMVINCPSCQKRFNIADEETDIKKRLKCPHCLNLFEVIWLYPFTLDFIEDNLLNSSHTVENIMN